MAQYKLHCFCQSGNSYKVALYLNCAGLDWEPVFVDFFNGATRDAKWRESVNEMGEAPVLETGGQEAHPVRRHPALPGGDDRQVRARDRRRAQRGAALDPVRQPQVHQLLRHLPLPESLAPQAPDANVLAFLKGRFDAAAGHRRQAPGGLEVHGRRQADHRRLLARRLRVLSRRGARLRLGQEPSQHPCLDRAAARAARLEGPLRADAGRAHQAAAGERSGAWRSRRD